MTRAVLQKRLSFGSANAFKRLAMAAQAAGSTGAIADYKKEWRQCFSLMCCNVSCIMPGAIESCASADLVSVLCIAEDCSCLPVNDSIPKTCTLLPFCVVYPKFGCCMTVADAIEDEAQRSPITPKKLDMRIAQGCCIGPAVACNQYLTMPHTCCLNEGSTCLCLGTDFAFPCMDSIPISCGAFGLMLIPGFACCPRLIDVMPQRFAAEVQAPNPEWGQQA